MSDELKEKMKQVEENAREDLDKLFGEESTPEESEEESTSVEEESTTDTESEESTSDEDQTDESEEQDQTEESEQTDETDESKADEKPGLTQAEIRAAIHSGWSMEDIQELAQTNPDLAKKHCAKALEAQNNLSKKFSELGRVQSEQKSEPKPEPKPEPKSSSIDFTAIEKEYEGDPIVGVLKQVVAQNQKLATDLESMRSTGTGQADTKIAQAQAQEDAAISQQIDTFFNREDVKAYKEVYGEAKGNDWDDLTQGQIKKRWAVVEQANLILLGAEKQGMDMSLEEAFERAHLLTTEGVREQAIRKEIKAKAVKRNKAITFEPTSPGQKPEGKPGDMAAVHKNAAQGLRKVFG